jgi:hypothetical protein
MSGPILQRLVADIERAGAEVGVSGEEFILNRIVAGVSPRAIMSQFGLSREMFYSWLRVGGPERRKLYDDARRLSADAQADLAGEVLEELAERGVVTSPEVQLANSRSNYLRWLAEVRNRDVYGTKPNGSIQINVGALHLDALRAAAVAVPVATVVVRERPVGPLLLEREQDVLTELIKA